MPGYNPAIDGRPEPGEVVWTWIAFDDGTGRGKERPVLVLEVDGARLAVVALSTRSETDDRHDRRRRSSPVWCDLGPGDWDRQGRPSRVRVDQVLTVSIYDARRVGAFVDETTFADVTRLVRRHR